jgi:Flp pilus assembly protein TadG
MMRARPVFRPLRWLDRFRRDRRGVSAVEFALISPVLILAYFGLAELSGALMAQRRVAHAASAIGDLVAQDSTITNAEMTDIFSVAQTILKPYSTTSLKLRVSSITADSNNSPKVKWSDGSGMTALAVGSTVSGLPSGVVTASGDNVIMAEATYTYTSPAAAVIKNGLNFSEKFYLRARKVSEVARTQ